MKPYNIIGIYFVFIAVGMFSSGASVILLTLDAGPLIMFFFLIPLIISLGVILFYFKEFAKVDKKFKGIE